MNSELLQSQPFVIIASDFQNLLMPITEVTTITKPIDDSDYFNNFLRINKQLLKVHNYRDICFPNITINQPANFKARTIKDYLKAKFIFMYSGVFLAALLEYLDNGKLRDVLGDPDITTTVQSILDEMTVTK